MFLPRSSRTSVEFSVYLLTLVLRLVDAAAAAVAAVAGLYVNDDGMHAHTHTDARFRHQRRANECQCGELRPQNLEQKQNDNARRTFYKCSGRFDVCVCVSVKLYDDDESRHKTTRAILRDRLE